jgi:DNA repair exonuclease SbcCD ATPase subunit
MQIVEIEVRHWRGLTATVGPFAEGLNAIFGPNESGKSRLIEALWFAIGESYKGAAGHKQALQSWNSSEPPSVKVTFEHGGVQYLLTKQYLKGAHALLAGGGKTYRNEDAEDALRGIFGTREGSARKEADGEDLGLWPMLIVRQGASGAAPASVLNSDSRDRLQSALSAEIGAAAVSARGAMLLEMAQAERDRYWTATGKPTKILADASVALAKCQTDRREADRAHHEQAATADDLAAKRAEQGEMNRRVAALEDRVRAADERLEATKHAADVLKAAEHRLEMADERLKQAKSERGKRLEAAATLAHETAELATAETDQAAKAGEESAIAEGKAEAKAKEAAATVAVARARKDAEMARKAAAAADLRRQIKEQRATLDKLEAATERRRVAVEARLSFREITKAQVRQIRNADEKLRDAESNLRGAAVSVTITPDGIDIIHDGLTIDGTLVNAGTPHRVDVVDERRITIEGIATIDVRPTLGSLSELKAACDQAREALAKRLDACGAASVDEAETMAEQWAVATGNIQTIEAEIEALSTVPLADLKEAVAALDAQLTKLGDLTGAMSEVDAGAGLHAAEKTLKAAQAAVGVSEKEEVRLNTECHSSAQRIGEARSRVKRAEDALARLSAQEDLDKAVLEADRTANEAAAQKAEAKRAYTSLGGDDAHADAQRLGRALTKLRNEATEIDVKVAALDHQLRHLLKSTKGVGTYEKLAEAEKAEEAAQTDLARVQARADAARRLHDVLQEARSRVVERLVGPVIARIQPYLEQIFPDSRVNAGADLSFDGLQTGDIEERAAYLSGGAREQFGLVTRIGIAQVLAGVGRLPLILDDSLVNSDPERVQRLIRVLDRASKDLQIILLSCNQPVFDGLGAEFQIRLAERDMRAR